MNDPITIKREDHHQIQAALKTAGELVIRERDLCATIDSCRTVLQSEGINWDKEFTAMHRNGDNRMAKLHRAEKKLSDLRAEIVGTLAPIVEAIWAEWWTVTRVHGHRELSPEEDATYQKISSGAVRVMEVLERLVEPAEYQRLSRMTGEMSDRDIEVLFQAEKIEDSPRQLVLLEA